MAKTLFILMQNYRDEEFTEPYTMLQQAGHIVDVAGLETGPAIGVNGHEHSPNLLFSDLSEAEFDQYDALVISGGPGSKKYLWNNEAIYKTIQYFHENKKIVAAICYAVIAIVQTTILRNKHATVFPTDEAKAIFEEYGVRFSKSGCVTLAPEKIITAQGPKFAKEFGQAIIDLLK
ncbi:DJ-1/PfpI family protein [Candidatus Dependentiae bacterium]|nr:DJ-1/PfpI family protein [Candidatus Dependentiae bacterium]